jgi:hypothetical protein
MAKTKLVLFALHKDLKDWKMASMWTRLVGVRGENEAINKVRGLMEKHNSRSCFALVGLTNGKYHLIKYLEVERVCCG